MKRARNVRADSSVTTEELEEAFTQCDEGGTGFIEIKKLKFVMRALGFEPRQKEIDQLIGQMIKNEAARAVNQDAFTMEELSYILNKKLEKSDIKQEISSTFKLFDADNKGFINFEDLKRISTELGENLKDEELQEMISEADLSQTGQVSEVDFEKVMKKTALY